jgi:hypothetical protein
MAIKETEDRLEEMRRSICTGNSMNTVATFMAIVELELFAQPEERKQFVLDVARKLEIVA